MLEIDSFSCLVNDDANVADLFSNQSPAARSLVVPDGYKQWLVWEQQANIEIFRKSTDPVQVPAGLVSRFDVALQTAPSLSVDFRRYILRGDQVLWLSHPYNTSSTTPFRDRAAAESLDVYLTASRSMVIADERFRGMSIKMPTDHPHGPKGEYQPTKADTSEDVVVALLHSKHLNRMDSVLGQDSKLILLPEVMTVAEKNSKIGMVVRDVTALDDGHYYVPALSIPWIGRDIAAANGETFEAFWQKNYAELLGEAKARLLLRYGIQMETPNAQNMLIQLDRNLKPTGRMVFRDVSDALFVDVVATGLGFDAQLAKDIAVKFDPHTYLKPYWSNSSWRFNEAGDKSVSS